MFDAPAPGPGTLEWLGVTYRTILSPGQSNGTMSIVDSLSPAGSGPPRHIHHGEDEIFVVLSGQCEFWLAGKSFIRGPARRPSCRAEPSTRSAFRDQNPAGTSSS